MSDDLRIAIDRKVFTHERGPIFEQIDLAIAARSFTALTGPSGVGKTTLLNIVAGLDPSFAGSITLPAGARVGYVFQEPRLLPWRTVAENIDLAVAAAGHPITPAEQRDLLTLAGLDQARDLHPTRLSLGMARRAALVRAFAVRPGLLLMDEPFVSLDMATAERLQALLRDLLARYPATVLFVTHNLREATRLADRVVVLAGLPARTVADLPIRLDPAARTDPAAIEAEAARLATAIAEAMPAGAPGLTLADLDGMRPTG